MSKHRKAILFYLCFALFASAALAAGDVRVSGPRTGLLYESSSRSIRPIMGLPGSSYLGDAALADVEWASIAPDGQSALVWREAALYLVRGLDSSEPAWTAFPGALAIPERAAWNGDASVAAVYAAGRLRWIRNLAAEAATDLTAVEGRVVALALDRAGSQALVGTEGGLYLVPQEGAAKLLARLNSPAAIVLSGDDHDLFVADRASRRVFQLRDFRGDANLLPLSGAGDGEPMGLALSRDGKTLFVASKGGDNAVDVIDLASRGLLSRIPLEFEPAFVEPLSGKALFLLKSVGEAGEPLQVLDITREPAVYFVPAGRGE